MSRRRPPLPTPFFEAPGGSHSRRRLLLISFLFPPDQQVGALRWQKMSRYVAERGWELDVIAFDPRCIESPDWSRLDDLPAGTRIYGIRPAVVPIARLIDAIWTLVRKARRADAGGKTESSPVANGDGSAAIASQRPTSFARHEIRWSSTEFRSYVRAYNAWAIYADLRRSARDASRLARRIVAAGLHDAIISSGPPHAAHEAARIASRETGLPFVMDLRDVWSLAQRCQEHIASPLLFHRGRRYERRAVEQASLIVANTDAARSAMGRVYPDAAARIVTITNGCDDEPLPRTRHDGPFTIAYAGTIYLDRDPGSLFRAAKRVIGEFDLTPSQFALKFIGANDASLPLTEMARAEGIGSFVHVGGSCPRAQALEFLARATMLVILPQDTDTAIPAKVFEYVRFEAWLLALAERESAVELLLRDTAADVVSSRDCDGIAAVMRRRYSQYATGARPARIAVDQRFSRRVQAELLLDALERCVRPTSTTRPTCSVAV